MLEKLFVYGTLGPGRPNAHVLESVGGSWLEGSVKGRLLAEGWGAAQGYPAIIPDPQGEPVQGFIYSSENFSRHWQRLDDFEGPGYQRVTVEVELTDGSKTTAFIYALKSP